MGVPPRQAPGRSRRHPARQRGLRWRVPRRRAGHPRRRSARRRRYARAPRAAVRLQARAVRGLRALPGWGGPRPGALGAEGDQGDGRLAPRGTAGTRCSASPPSPRTTSRSGRPGPSPALGKAFYARVFLYVDKQPAEAPSVLYHWTLIEASEPPRTPATASGWAATSRRGLPRRLAPVHYETGLPHHEARDRSVRTPPP